MRTLAQGGAAGPVELRNLGKALTEAADDIRQQKRERAHKALKHNHIMPAAFLSVFLLLMKKPRHYSGQCRGVSFSVSRAALARRVALFA